MSLLARLNAEGATVIVVTHDPAVAAVAKCRIEVRDGRVSSRLGGLAGGPAGTSAGARI
jgi:ABC-type lipoprotein export system ATPase subunit